MRTIIITMLVLFAGITLNAQNNINPVLSSIEEKQYNPESPPRTS
jgi:hypothetical protein